MNRVEKIKKKLKKSIDEMPVERLAVFLTVSGDVDSRMAQIGDVYKRQFLFGMIRQISGRSVLWITSKATLIQA